MSRKLLKYGIGILARQPEFPVSGEGSRTNIIAPDSVIVRTSEAPFREPHLMPPCSEMNIEENWRRWQRTLHLYRTCRDYASIVVPKDVLLDQPIRIRSGMISGIDIDVGEGGEATIIEERTSESDAVLDVRVRVGPRADVTYVSTRPLTTRHDEHVERLAFVEKGGRMLWQEAVTGGTTFQANTRTVLVGERAEVVVESALLASGDEQCDVSHFVSHAAPETKSGIRVRAAACHRAKILHRGKVMIDEGMRGCAAFQREDVLLLSPQAEADAIPMLEVAEPDVCCGHASTIGRLDEEKLFYAMSRGIGRAEAEHMLVEAFFQPIVSSLRDEGVADDFRTSLFAKVSPL